MTKVILLRDLKKFTETVTHGILLPVRPAAEDIGPPAGMLEPNGHPSPAWDPNETENPPPRPPNVYQMRLPRFRDATRKAPYILHQVLTGKDIQTAGRPLDSSALVRTVFCVYHENEEEGALSLLNLMESLRIALLERPVLPGPFALDLKAGLETLAYPDDGDPRTAPYYLGEMMSTWRVEPVRRLDASRVIHGIPPFDPKAKHLEESIDCGHPLDPDGPAPAEIEGSKEWYFSHFPPGWNKQDE